MRNLPAMADNTRIPGSASGDAPDHRRRLAEAWAGQHLDWPEWTSTAISSDAGFRRYFRLSNGNESRVVMDAPPETENTRAFTRIAMLLHAAGVHAPRIDAHDPGSGFMLIEDLGDRSYLAALDTGNADTLFGDATDALITMQVSINPDSLPAYDRNRLQTELDLFPDWYLTRHLNTRPGADQRETWDRVCERLIANALDQQTVFVHRDFMPRNLMVCDPNPGIIDFQDAVAGPVAYDPVCLFRDAFVSWPTDRVDDWLENYRRRAHAAGLPITGDPDTWRRQCDLMGVQRHLKVIGIFARIRYRDGKPAYLEDAPRFFRYLEQAIARNPELGELGRLLASWQMPA